MNLGVDKLMREAMANGAVLSGGSAGMIIWFDGGHSDSSMHEFKIPTLRVKLIFCSLFVFFVSLF